MFVQDFFFFPKYLKNNNKQNKVNDSFHFTIEELVNDWLMEKGLEFYTAWLLIYFNFYVCGTLQAHLIFKRMAILKT